MTKLAENISRETGFLLLRNRHINIIDEGDAYKTLDLYNQWMDEDGGPRSARFCATSRQELVYNSGSGQTMIKLCWGSGWDGWDGTYIEARGDEAQRQEVMEEIEAAKEKKYYQKHQ